MLRRAGENDATHVALIPTLGQHPAIRDDLDLAAGQARQDGLALVYRGRAVYMLGHDAGAAEFVLDVNRVLDTDMSAEELEVWLIDADRRYREEGPEMSWPKAYASWLLAGWD